MKTQRLGVAFKINTNIYLRNMEGFGPKTLYISEIDVWAHFENPANKVPWEISVSLGANLKGVNIGGAFSVHRQPPKGSLIKGNQEDRWGQIISFLCANKVSYLRPKQV